jgi:probable phosphoglycerate mutase
MPDRIADRRPLLLVTRHGETEWNVIDRIQGHEDVPLSPRGVEQARALGERLAREGVARIVSSDLLRARVTAEAVASASGAALSFDGRLREQNMGSWQGASFADARAADPDLAERFARREPHVRPPGGESREELFTRVWDAVDEHATPGSAGPLLLVGHGGVLQMILYRVLGLPLSSPRRFSLPNCGLSSLVDRDGAWYVTCLSDTSHLPTPPGASFPFE